MNSFQEVVAIGIERGWVHPRTDVPLSAEAYKRKIYADENRALGLTAGGKPRKRNLHRHPQLVGITNRREYMAKYMQIWRKEKSANRDRGTGRVKPHGASMTARKVTANDEYEVACGEARQQGHNRPSLTFFERKYGLKPGQLKYYRANRGRRKTPEPEPHYMMA